MSTSQRRFVVPLLLIAAAITVGVLWTVPRGIRFYYDRNGPNVPPNIDFYAYHTAGRSYARGLDPYRDQSGVDPTLSDRRPGGWSRYIYPPAILPLLAPLAELEYDRARGLWLALNLMAFGVAIAAVVGTRPVGDRMLTAAVASVITAGSHPLLFHVRQGQVDLLVASLAALAFVLAERRNAPASAAILASASWIKPHAVALLASASAGGRDRRYAFLFVAFAMAIGGWSLVAVPIRWHVEYATVVLPTLSGGDKYFYNQSLIRLLPRLGPLPVLVSVAGFAGFFVLSWKLGTGWQRARSEDDVLARDTRALLFLTNILVVLVFSPIAWHMAYVWSILPAAIAAPAYGRRAGRVLTACSAGSLLLMHAPVSGRPVLGVVNLVGAAALLTCVLAALFRWRSVPSR